MSGCVSGLQQMFGRTLARQQHKLSAPAYFGSDFSRPIELGMGLFFGDVVNSSGRLVRYCGERYGTGHIIYIPSHSTPSAKIFRENDRLTPVIHPLEHREETMELVIRPVDHWQADYGSRQLR